MSGAVAMTVKSLGVVSNPSQRAADIGAIIAVAHRDGPPAPASPALTTPEPLPVPASLPDPLPVPPPLELLPPLELPPFPEPAPLELLPAIAEPLLLEPTIGLPLLEPVMVAIPVSIPVPVPVPVPVPEFVGSMVPDDDPPPPPVFGPLLFDEHAAITATIGITTHANVDETLPDMVNRIATFPLTPVYKPILLAQERPPDPATDLRGSIDRNRLIDKVSRARRNHLIAKKESTVAGGRTSNEPPVTESIQLGDHSKNKCKAAGNAGWR